MNHRVSKITILLVLSSTYFRGKGGSCNGSIVCYYHTKPAYFSVLIKTFPASIPKLAFTLQNIHAHFIMGAIKQ